MQTPLDDTEKYTKSKTMRVIPNSECPSTTKTSPTMTILLDDYDHVHNKYMENRVLSALENYEESGKKKYAEQVIRFLGNNKTQIKKYVVTAGMKTQWKNILERVFEMYEREIQALEPPRNREEKRVQFSYICTKRPFVALYDQIVSHEKLKKKTSHNTYELYTLEDYISAM